MEMGNIGMMGGFGMLVFWGLLILLIVWIVRMVFGSSDNVSAPAGQKARDILEKRYANGEIDQNEFEEKRRDLGF